MDPFFIMKNISEHITYKEATKSITAIQNHIDNRPDEKQIRNMRDLADNVFEPLRKGLGDKPITISIFYRSPELNQLINGSSPTSQHMATSGAAMDIDNEWRVEGPTNSEIFYYIYDNLEYDQLIWEYGDDKEPGWVHVSFKRGHNRKQALSKSNKSYHYPPFVDKRA